jgi:RNA polymerase sigma-70 factor (ECF subfamily)
MGRLGASVEEIEAVYRRRAEGFFRLAYAHIGNVESARDAVQDGFANAVRSRASFRREGPLDAWIARCVTNAALDMSRADALRRSPLPPEEHEDSGPSPDGSLLMLRAAVHDLPARQRDALFLRHYLDFDYAAIAATLGIEVGTVSATLHAARAALRDSLQEVH